MQIEAEPVLFPAVAAVPVADLTNQTALTALMSLSTSVMPTSAFPTSYVSSEVPTERDFVTMSQVDGLSDKAPAVNTNTMNTDGSSLPPLDDSDMQIAQDQILGTSETTSRNNPNQFQRSLRNIKADERTFKTLVKTKICKLTKQIASTPEILHGHNSVSFIETPSCAREVRKAGDKQWETIWTK